MSVCFPRITKADRALEEGNYSHCIAVLSRAIVLEPHNLKLFKKRADAYFQLEDYTSAIANYNKAISLAPSEATSLAARMADAYFKSGKVLCSQNNLEAGLEAFTKASELHPDERDYTMQRWVWIYIHNYTCFYVHGQHVHTCFHVSNYRILYGTCVLMSTTVVTRTWARVKLACFLFSRVLCLLSLKRYEDCLQMVEAELEHGLPTPQLYLIHAKISIMFEKVHTMYIAT